MFYSVVLAFMVCFSLAVEAKGFKPPADFFTNRPAPKQKRLLMITGCSRSGTSYISDFLKLNGLHVEHEADAPDGTVSWLMAVDSDKTPWGPGSNRYKYKHILHQVRNPLKSIASICHEDLRAWQYICQFIPEIQFNEDPWIKAAKYWYYWNLKAEDKAEFTYRIEDLEKVLPKLSRILGVRLDPIYLSQVPTNCNTRNYTTSLSWRELKMILEPAMFKRLTNLAKRYGYPTQDT